MKDVTLAGCKLDTHFHVCAFFRSREEQYQILSSFITDGIEGGEKEVHITDPLHYQDHLQRLETLGLPIADCSRTGQLEVFTWHQAYLRDGRFDAATMLALVEEVVKTARAQGFPRVRFMGQMEWSLEDHPGVEQLIEYEAKVDEVLDRYRQPAVCMYDLNRYTGAQVVEVLRTHRLAILGGVLRENPFYVPPGELLGRNGTRPS